MTQAQSLVQTSESRLVNSRHGERRRDLGTVIVVNILHLNREAGAPEVKMVRAANRRAENFRKRTVSAQVLEDGAYVQA